MNEKTHLVSISTPNGGHLAKTNHDEAEFRAKMEQIGAVEVAPLVFEVEEEQVTYSYIA